MVIAGSNPESGLCEILENKNHPWFVGVQFHPEVRDTAEGEKIYDNFCNICGITDRFPAHNVSKEKIATLSKKIAGKKVLIALSGGSDSSVVAYLLKEAMRPQGDTLGNSQGVTLKPRLKGIYIRGIDRPDDEAYVQKYFGNQDWISVEIVDATKEFLKALKGKVSMAEKRIAMRGVYKEVLEKKIKEFNTGSDDTIKWVKEKFAQKVKDDSQEGLQKGVNGTPATFVNGQLVSGALPYESFKQIIDSLLKQ